MKHRTPVSDTEAEEMFEYWCKIQSISKTAKQFNHAQTTIHRIKKRDNWHERYDKIRGNIQKTVDKKAEQKVKSNLDYVVALKKKILKELFNKEQLNAAIKDLIQLMEYEDKLLGNLPDGGGDNVVNLGIIGASREDLDRLIKEYGEACGITIPANRL